MLTCKVGEKTINTIDYNDQQLRKWHNKNILKCPICGNKMFYRNGEIKVAYFAHQPGSDCVDTILGSEPETEEHRQSIKDIYLYLKNNINAKDIILESWIAETKQRPDISFTYNKKKYVIEVQCSPIATQYLERHRLYQLAGIEDIWILGFDKYKGNCTVDGYRKTKTIERQLLYNQKLIYYNYLSKKIIFVKENSFSALLDRKTTFDLQFNEIDLSNVDLGQLVEENIQNKENINNIKKIIQQNIEKYCDIIKYNYYVKSLDKRVLCYFEIKNKKYVIDYIAAYIQYKDCKEMIDNYSEINIKSFIFLNYNFYKDVKVDDIIDNEYKKVMSYTPLDECIDIRTFFIDKNSILFFTSKNRHRASTIINKIKKEIDDRDSNKYMINKNYKKEIDTIVMNMHINQYIHNAILTIRQDKFKSFLLKNIKFIEGNLIDKNTYNIMNELLQNEDTIVKDIYKKQYDYLLYQQESYNESVKIEKNKFDKFKKIIKGKFEANNVLYNLDYSATFMDKKGNTQKYINLINFEIDNKKYIIFDGAESLIHNEIGINISDCDTKDFIVIRLEYIDRYLDNKWILFKNYYKSIELRTIIYLNPNVNYKYPKLIDDNIIINFFYKNKFKKVKKEIRYCYLPYYDFIKKIDILKEAMLKIENIKEDREGEIYNKINNINENKIYNIDDFNYTITDNDINKIIYNALYPIIIRIKEQNCIEGDFNIMLNPAFTKRDHGFELWKIKDYIEILYNIGINNINNIEHDYYQDNI